MTQLGNNIQAEFDKEKIRERYLSAIDRIVGNAPGKKFKSIRQFCEATKELGEGSVISAPQINNLKIKKNYVSDKMLFAMHMMANDVVDIREILTGISAVEYTDFALPSGSAVVSLESVEKTKALMNLLFMEVKSMTSSL